MHTLSPIPQFAAACVRSVDSCGTVRYTVHGKIQVDVREQLRRDVLEDLIAGERAFVISLATCGYLDSAGIRVLANLANKIRHIGGSLILEDTNEDLQKLFELTQLAGLFTLRSRVKP